MTSTDRGNRDVGKRTWGSLLAVWVAIALGVPSRATASERGHLGVVFTRKSVDLPALSSSTAREVRVRLGDTVTQGQVLLVLESVGLDQEIAAAQAAVHAAHADSMRAAADLAQASHLLERREHLPDVFTQEDLEAVKARKAAAEAAIASASAITEQRVASLRSQIEMKDALTIKAPFSGQVAMCLVNPGEFVRAGQVLVRLANTRDLWVRFAVAVDSSAWLAPHRRVLVRVDGSNQAFHGEVRQVSPEIDAVSGMILAEAIVDPATAGSRPPLGAAVRVFPASE